jgi:septal ring factor EnvC (AmiA/AmiB activator)
MQDSGLLLHPDGPLPSLRAGLLIAAMSPALQAEAAALRAQFDEVALLRSLQEGSAATLAEGLAGAQEARVRLSRAIAERGPLPRRPPADPEALAAILAAADTLESFAAGLMAVPLAGPEPATPPFAAVRGTLPLPVEATVLRRFRSPDAAGVARPGFVLAAAPQALVTAPSAATVRYAGPLLDYGNVIVLEPGAGYLLILAGLGQMFVAESEVVTAGAALGLVGGASPGASAPPGAVEQRGGGDRSETLYMEVREGGVPVDPETWFALERG